MPKDNPRSIDSSATLDARDDLLDCRMAMLGLEATDKGAVIDQIRRRCRSCGYREACAVDLKRDPNNPVWETYCPNAETLVALAEVSWLPK